jgi:hypothetical protein
MKNSLDNLPAIIYFSKIYTLHVFLSNLPSKKGRSNVTYPMTVGLTVKTAEVAVSLLWLAETLHNTSNLASKDSTQF